MLEQRKARSGKGRKHCLGCRRPGRGRICNRCLKRSYQYRGVPLSELAPLFGVEPLRTRGWRQKPWLENAFSNA